MNPFLLFLKAHGLPSPVEEYHFHPTRKWRFDYAWVEQKVAIEQQGGIWRRRGGAHTGLGHLRDLMKLNTAQIMGWIVLQFPTEEMYGQEVVLRLQEALAMGERRRRMEVDTGEQIHDKHGEGSTG